MKKETVRTLTIVAAVLILLAVLGLGSAVWLFTRSVNIGTADEAEATGHFDEVRGRFAGVTPVLAIVDDEPVVRRRPPAEGGGDVSTLRIIVWEPEDGSFSRIDVPFWLLRLKSGPIEIMANGTPIRESDLGLTVEQLERFGSTLVLDHVGRGGDRILIWTD